VSYIGPDAKDPSVEAALPSIINVAAVLVTPNVTNVINRTGV
jgi:hypothetical protein